MRRKTTPVTWHSCVMACGYRSLRTRERWEHASTCTSMTSMRSTPNWWRRAFSWTLYRTRHGECADLPPPIPTTTRSGLDRKYDAAERPAHYRICDVVRIMGRLFFASEQRRLNGNPIES